MADYIGLLHVLNPFAPHITEELNRLLSEQFPDLPKQQLALQPWPNFDPAFLVDLTKEIPVQV
ncbi:class I tRNA ligase family protein, partial [Klebsiella pneumoniae]|uniref:class I tRNA ligase family protein n=1 Tax=Klebsiella pneumoniae TaxID=573 RepID=UPI003A8BA432